MSVIAVSERKIQRMDSNQQPTGAPYVHDQDIVAHSCTDHAVYFADRKGRITLLNAQLQFLQVHLTTYKISFLLATNLYLWVGTETGDILKMRLPYLRNIELYEIPKDVLLQRSIRNLTITSTGFIAGGEGSAVHLWNEKNQAFESNDSRSKTLYLSRLKATKASCTKFDQESIIRV